MLGPRTLKTGVILMALLILLALSFPHTAVIAQFQGLTNHAKGWQHGGASVPATTTAQAADSTTQIQVQQKSRTSSSTAAPISSSSPEALKAIPTPQAPKVGVDESKFNFDKSFFQADLPWFQLPRFDVSKLRTIAPHNYQGPGHPAFATYFASRDSSTSDPYFLAAQQIVYRLLWDPRSRSSKHPVVVFVAPFVASEQRDYFAAAGAIVRELALVPFISNGSSKDLTGRLIDLFSKLEMWAQPDFSRIAYLDSDAFPLANIDALFQLAAEQDCRQDRLKEEDRPHTDELCKYVFTGHPDSTNAGAINAGVMVFKPSEAMHSVLIREARDPSNFDNGLAEQALLNYVFRPDGPFPPDASLSEAWNGSPNTPNKGGALYILHAKIWAMFFEQPRDWTTNLFNDTWHKMVNLYENEKFLQLRMNDAAHSTSL